MSQTIFAPKLTQSDESDSPKAQPSQPTKDIASQWLLSIAHWLLVIFSGLLPVFFLPGLWGSLAFQKVLLAMGVVGGVVVLLSLLALRTRTIVSVVPMSLALFWGVVLSAGLSALFSPNWLSAFRGVAVESQTVTFLVLLAGVMTVALVLQRAKRATMLLFSALAMGGLALLVYVVSRLLFGPVLAFGSFNAVTVSPIGTFNDLAVFAGLTIVLSLVGLLQLRARPVLRGFLVGLTAVALIALAAVNFFYIWLIVGFFSLLVLLYLISQDTLFASVAKDTDQPQSPKTVSKLTISVAAAICIVSGGFIVAGDYFGQTVSDALAVEYLEVRPSLGATVNLLQATYQEDLLFGAGPNQFISSWRSFKDPSINQTIFWSTDFRSGSGYIPTMFVNLGLIGSLFIVAFHLWYLWNGARMLLRPASADRFWYFAGLLSFTGAVFLWGISYVYIPGSTLLLLAALLTGVSLAAGGVLQPQRAVTIALATNQQRGFALMAIAIVFISAAMGTWFTYGKQYVAQASFTQTQATESDLEVLDQAALASFILYPDSQFLSVRARLALLEMNEILAIEEPSETDQQRFLAASNQAVTFAEAAIAQAKTEPTHHAILAGVYNNLAVAGVSDAVERVTSSIDAAQALDPQNPTYALLSARFAANRGDTEASRAALMQALQQKNNFAEALYLLAQLDIAEGNVESAIATTEAIIRLEPNNPTRYYQLGILESSAGNTADAKRAYRTAIQLDPNFANARYLLALLQIADGETEQALTELQFIQESNTDNVQLQELITALEAGEVPAIADSAEVSVNENQPVVVDDGVTSPVLPDSDLLTPLNTVGDSQSDEPATATPVIEEQEQPVEGEPVEETTE